MGVSSMAGNTFFERVELMAIWEGGNLPADDYIKQVRRCHCGPGFRLAACWNRLVETVQTRKKTGKKRGRNGRDTV